MARRALLHLLFALLFCLGWATLGKLLEVALALVFKHDEAHGAPRAPAPRSGRSSAWNLVGWIFVTLPFGVIVYLSIAGIAHAIRYFFEATDRELQLARVSEQLASTRLAALQAQLNPHFLFNSLNTIAVLVRDGENQSATRVIEQLSDVLRSTLDGTQASEVTLEDELDAGAAIPRRRAGALLRSAPAGARHRARRPCRRRFPASRSQHLVENALRHGIAKRTDAGRVAIAARRAGGDTRDVRRRRRSGTFPDAAAAPGHGLDNTRERLRTLYGERASLDVIRARRPRHRRASAHSLPRAGAATRHPMTGHRSGSRAAPFTVLVADDEPAARRGVRQLLAAFPEFTIVGECRDGREVLAALDTLKPDVIFLDIQMPEVDGFEVIRRRTPARMPATVFLTAYDRFAIRAFEAEAHDYLVKPVSEARFAATIARLVKRLAPAGSRRPS